MIERVKRLVTQPTAAMTRKQFWSAIVGGGITVGFWLLKVLAEITAPPEIVGTVVSMGMASVGYLVRDRET